MAKKLNAKVEYTGEGELISDISTTKPLKKATKKATKPTKKATKKTTKKAEKVINIKKQVTKPTLKDHEIFQNILDKGEYFYMIHKGIEIYDSIKNKNNLLIFNEDYFILNNEIISYNGLSIKFKK